MAGGDYRRQVSYRTFLREHESFLYFESAQSDQKPVLVIPDFSAEPGRIIALRVFPVCGGGSDPLMIKAAKLKGLFEIEWSRSYPLEDFPHNFPA